MKHEVAVLDFGSQYTQLIIRRVRELGYFARLFQPEKAAELGEPGAIILSGGPKSVRDADAPMADMEALEGYGVPILGICYGMQLLNRHHGGAVEPGSTREYGPARLRPENRHPLYAGVTADSGIWMSHSDTCTVLPQGAKVIARNEEDVPVSIEFRENICGIQFHPEVTHSEEGKRILGNFLESAPALAEFSIHDFAEELVARVRATVGDREVVCGVSGGVDSTVVAVLLHRAGVKVRNVFVDNGLMRKSEATEVMARFAELGVPVEHVDASARFLDALAGQDDPEEKRRIIGRLFLDVFWDAVGDAEMLAQGTLYPDVIESASNTNSKASVIKTHHNRVDKVLELQAQGRVIEPLDELFKDEVRALGQVLGISRDALWRHPFPGPGLAVRVPGEVTAEKLEMVREADAIFIGELQASGWYDKVWQAYAGILPIRTVGVKGDERAYEFPIVLRAVVSDDAMTADWVALPDELLRKVSNRILNKVKGVNRVFYDISTKPPASIELE